MKRGGTTSPGSPTSPTRVHAPRGRLSPIHLPLSAGLGCGAGIERQMRRCERGRADSGQEDGGGSALGRIRPARAHPQILDLLGGTG